MNELNSKEMEAGIQMVREMSAQSSRNPEQASLFYRLGLEALKKPETPRLVFESGVPIEDQIRHIEEQLSSLRQKQIACTHTRSFQQGVDRMHAKAFEVIKKFIADKNALESISKCLYEANDELVSDHLNEPVTHDSSISKDRGTW